MSTKNKFFTPADHRWLKEGQERRWNLPARPGSFWCTRVVRHCRALSVVWKAYFEFDRDDPKWVDLWKAEWLAYAIRKGWA